MWLFYAFLRIALLIGLKDFVYLTSIRWADNYPANWRRPGAAWEIQKDLLKKGFFECPSCFWATKIDQEHILRNEGFCYEQHHGNPSVSWEDETDPQLQFDKVPDGAMH